MITDTEVLEAALIGLEHQRSQVGERMEELRRRLGVRSPGRPAETSTADLSRAGRKRRRMSAAGRGAIAAAQRKRWAALKKGTVAKAVSAKATPGKKKRKISAAGMKRILAATKKRWAEFHAKKAAAKKAAAAAKKTAAKKIAPASKKAVTKGPATKNAAVPQQTASTD